MDGVFFDRPILNSPYQYPQYPARHWELDADGQPSQHIIESRRRAEFITSISKLRKRKDSGGQSRTAQGNESQGLFVFDECLRRFCSPNKGFAKHRFRRKRLVFGLLLVNCQKS
jgi:hypothetical protein